MNKNDNVLQEWAELDCDSFDLDELESKLNAELEMQMSDLKGLEADREKIGNPDTIGHTVMNVVWEQFINQVGVIAGEDFIKENRGLTLDLRDLAHIQTSENFDKGKIATHNDKIDYQQRYNDWQSNFRHDENGEIITHQTRSGKEEATLVSGARKAFDQGRPIGSVERGTDMDHTISAGEIIRDPAANAHMSKEEQRAFANSDANLNEMDAAQNRSKGDKSMSEWLDEPNKNGQKPNEIFEISEEKDKQYREKDKEARTEYEKQKKEGEQRSIKTGKQSQKEELWRIGGKALRSVVMGLLASLIKDIIRKLVSWMRSGSRKLDTFIDSVKEAIKSFVSNIKSHLLNAGNTLITAITTAIFGPIIGLLKKAWLFLKQGWYSIKEAINFLENPKNKTMPFSIKMLEVGKIVVVGLTAGGTIVLSEVIDKGLMSIPIFAVEIPMVGTLASILGMFLGALGCGLIGALALNMIDRLIVKKLKIINTQQQIAKKNEILQKEDILIDVAKIKVLNARNQTFSSIQERHAEAASYLNNIVTEIKKDSEIINSEVRERSSLEESSEIDKKNDEALTQLFGALKDL